MKYGLGYRAAFQYERLGGVLESATPRMGSLGLHNRIMTLAVSLIYEI